jgi:hypothetical protein
MQLTQEQQLAAEFLRRAEPIRARVDRARAPAVADFVEHYIGALVSFGSAEQHARRGERAKALDRQTERVEPAARRARQQNDRGLKELGGVREALARAKGEVGQSLPEQADVREVIQELQDEWRAQLLDVDTAGDEANELADAATALFEVAARGETRALLDHLDDSVAELDRLRRRDDRGVHGNPFPVWKVIALVIMLGAIVWLYFQCTWWGGCTATQAAIAFAIAAGASYFVYGC